MEKVAVSGGCLLKAKSCGIRRGVWPPVHLAVERAAQFTLLKTQPQRELQLAADIYQASVKVTHVQEKAGNPLLPRCGSKPFKISIFRNRKLQNFTVTGPDISYFF